MSNDTGGKGTILVAIDGSHTSLVAAGVAGQLARSLGAHLGMIHVLDAPMRGFWAGVEDRIQDDIRAQAEATLGEIADKIRESCNVMPEFYIVEGVPDEEIMKAVKEDPRIMMVVAGSQGLATETKSQLRLRHGAGKLAAKLSDRLPVPLLLVPRNIDVAHICSAMAKYRGEPATE